MPQLTFTDEDMADLDYTINRALEPMQRIMRLGRSVNMKLEALAAAEQAAMVAADKKAAEERKQNELSKQLRQEELARGEQALAEHIASGGAKPNGTLAPADSSAGSGSSAVAQAEAA